MLIYYVWKEDVAMRSRVPTLDLAMIEPDRKHHQTSFYLANRWTDVASRLCSPSIQDRSDFLPECIYVTYDTSKTNNLRVLLACLHDSVTSHEPCLILFDQWTTVLSFDVIQEKIQSVDPSTYHVINLLRSMDRCDWNLPVDDGVVRSRHTMGDQVFCFSPAGRSFLLAHPLVEKHDLLSYQGCMEPLIVETSAQDTDIGFRDTKHVPKTLRRVMEKMNRFTSEARDRARQLTSKNDLPTRSHLTTCQDFEPDALNIFMHHVVESEDLFVCLVFTPQLFCYDVHALTDPGKTQECFVPAIPKSSRAVRASEALKVANMMKYGASFALNAFLVFILLIIVIGLLIYIAVRVNQPTQCKIPNKKYEMR